MLPHDSPVAAAQQSINIPVMAQENRAMAFAPGRLLQTIGRIARVFIGKFPR
jgi:hypothetical protein